MNKFKKFINITTIPFTIMGIVIVILAYYEAKSDLLIKQKEQAVLNYYQDVETLLDSLCIDCGDSIFKTKVGAKYLDSKYKFDSLFINNNYETDNRN